LGFGLRAEDREDLSDNMGAGAAEVALGRAGAYWGEPVSGSRAYRESEERQGLPSRELEQYRARTAQESMCVTQAFSDLDIA
jgi:hypothetical protein